MPQAIRTIILKDLGNQSAGAIGAARETRASANTSGPNFTWAKIAGEIADLKIRTERRKLVSSAGPVS
jgi:hypothetical protein